MLYDTYEIPSEVAFDPEQPSLGRIRVDSVTPPHNYVIIKRCISKVDQTPAITHASLFADISCNTPLKEDQTISFLRSDYPGLSPEEPMAIVLNPIPDGTYAIKNRSGNIYWKAWDKPYRVYFVGNHYLIDRYGQHVVPPRVEVNEHSPIFQVFRG